MCKILFTYAETVEVSSSGNEELRRVAAKNLELEQQLNLLRQQLQQQVTSRIYHVFFGEYTTIVVALNSLSFLLYQLA
jgi:hypothetical protein